MTKLSTILLSLLLGLAGCVGSPDDVIEDELPEDVDASVVIVDNDTGVESDAHVVIEADAGVPTEDAETPDVDASVVVVVEEDAAVVEEDAGEPVTADSSVEEFVCRGVSWNSPEVESCKLPLTFECPIGYHTFELPHQGFTICGCESPESLPGDLTCLTTALAGL